MIMIESRTDVVTGRSQTCDFEWQIFGLEIEDPPRPIRSLI
jgi:hypothetical protein